MTSTIYTATPLTRSKPANRPDGSIHQPRPHHHRRSRTTTLGETAIGDCYVGLVVSPGEMFTYPGSSQIRSVDSNGKGRWSAIPFVSFSGAVDFTVGSERFAAHPQGDGTWIIDSAGTETAAAPTRIPPRPSNTKYQKTNGNVLVTWDPSPGATHYEVHNCYTSTSVIDSHKNCNERFWWSRLASVVSETTYLHEDPYSAQPTITRLQVVCMQQDREIPIRGARYFSKLKPAEGSVQTCQRNCVLNHQDYIHQCVWRCEEDDSTGR